ncbi:hypothetical protein A4X06_0g9194, partial [Tilletia controversa]
MGVLWVPGLAVSLLSVPTLQRQGGIKVTFDEKGAVITDSAGNQLRAWLDAAAGVSVIKARTSAGTSSAMVLAAEALAGSFPVGGSEREATMESLFTGGSSVEPEAAVQQDLRNESVGTDADPTSAADQQQLIVRGVLALILLWHRRLGHAGVKAIRQLARVASYLKIPYKQVERLYRAMQVCDTCVETKMARLPFPHSLHRSLVVLELVFVDLLGPVSTTSPFSYVMVIVDDFSRKAWGVVLSSKSQAFERLKEWTKQQEVQTEKKLKTLRSDGGGEFSSHAMQDWVLEQGITRQITAPYTSVQNGIVERINRTLQDRMRSMMLSAKALAEFWVLAFMAAIYQYNRTPSTAIGGALPETKWLGKPADLSMLRVWGCVAWVKIHPAQREDGKHLSARAARGMFLGYSTEHKTWLVWTPGNTGKQFRHSRDVRFDENRNYWDIVLSRQRTEVFGPEEPEEVDWHEVTGEDPKTINVDTYLGSNAAPPPAHESGPVVHQPPTQQDDQVSVGAHGTVDLQDAVSVGAPSEALDDLMYDLPLTDLLASPIRNQEPPMLLDLMRDTPELEPIRNAVRAPTPATAFLPPSQPAFEEDRSEPPEAPLRSARYLRAEAREIRSQGLAKTVVGADKIFGQALSSVASSRMRTSADGLMLEPTFRHEARQRSDWGKWKEAENEQLKALEEMQTWKVIELPKGKASIGCRWVYKLKLDEDGNASRYKARLVAQGFSQVPGRDYTETYAPTARMDTVRLVLTICAQHDLIVHQMDVVVAYLQGHLKDEIYMRLPPEYAERAGAVGNNLVLKLLRPLYGLKQAGKVWNDKLHSILMARGFKR